MKAEVIGWVATAVATPIVIVTLCWTLVIFQYHRHYWRSTDVLLVAILSQGVIKQVATFAYTILTLLQTLDSSEAWCSGIVWLLTSIHILQAGTLATLIFSRLLAVRSPMKYRQAVKKTHVVYHLVSLSVLSACIGVAAVLAEGKQSSASQDITNATTNSYDAKMHHCTFLPHEMDRRYAILSFTLHSLIDVTSIIALIATLFSWCCLYRRQKSNLSVSQPSTMIGGRGNQKRQQLLTSSSDLSAMSDISLTSTARNGNTVIQGGSNGGNERNVTDSDIKCTTTSSNFMNGLLASNLRYIENGDGKLQPTMTFVPPPPKTTSLDALPSLSCNNGFVNGGKSASDVNCFRPNSNSAFHAMFPNSSSQFTSASIDKSTDTFKSCAIISNYNHSAPKSLTTNDSNYDETYDRTYGARGNGGNEDGCRWTSESSYISTSTSSTNSRAPCLARQAIREDGLMLGQEDLRLPPVVTMLVFCYIINHLPVLGLTAIGMFAPWLLPGVWSLSALVLWAGLAEEFLLPILLALCDKNFTTWVANIYTCRDRRVADLARQHQGLDGKFRVFNTQSLQQSEVQTSHQQHQQQTQQHQQLQQEPVKFPITNGSLFTSVDGRLPIIHNYRRGKGMRTSAALPTHCVSMGLPNANARRSEMLQTLITLNSAAIESQHSEIFKHRSNSAEETHKLNHTFTERAYLPTGMDTIEKKVISKVNDSSREETESQNVLLSDFGLSSINLEHQSDCEEDLNSEDLMEYNVDDNDDDNEDDDDEPIYATLSSRSCCSATTAANDDFEFFQHEEKFSKLAHGTDGSALTQNNDSPGQSPLYRYQRDMRDSGDFESQAFQCAGWTVDQNNEVLKLVLPLIESYSNQKDDTAIQKNMTPQMKNLKQNQEAIAQNARDILKTVIENEFKNSRQHIFKESMRSSSSSDSKYKDSSSCSYQSQSELNNDSKSSCAPSLEYESQSSFESLDYKPQVSNGCRKKRNKKQNLLAASVSLNNLDELLLEEEEEDGTLRNRSSRSSPNERGVHGFQIEKSPEEKEVVFQLPVKSESVLSLYQLDLDNKPKTSNIISKEPNSQHFHKQNVSSRCPSKYPIRLERSHRVDHQTPPVRRLRRHKKLPVPVLSVESLTTALNRAGVSYLDNGDLCRHGSVPDLKRVFVSDYL